MRIATHWASLLLLLGCGCSRTDKVGAGGSGGGSDSLQKESGAPQAVVAVGACDRMATEPICPRHAQCPETWVGPGEHAGWCAQGNWLSRLAGESYQCGGIHVVTLRGVDDGHSFFYGDNGRLVARVSRGLGHTSCFGAVPEVIEKKCVHLSSWSCQPSGSSSVSNE